MTINAATDRIEQAITRNVLVVDDDPISREMLSAILSSEFAVDRATNGAEAVSMLTENPTRYSCVLLDLVMPIMDGRTALAMIQSDASISRIPIIVLTAEKSAEAESLKLGASDFITKPFDAAEIVIARVKKTVDLAESARVIEAKEADPLTGLYSSAFFFEYCHRIENAHRTITMDAIAIDISHFKLINAIYGRDYGDAVLQGIGEFIGTVAHDHNGIACRVDADTFLLFIQHMASYSDLFSEAYGALSERFGSQGIHVKVGICKFDNSPVTIEERFERARAACDTIGDNRAIPYAFFDMSLYQKQLEEERLATDARDALSNHEFILHYQPQFAIQGETNTMVGVEALVRWEHPEQGLIMPGQFIPLFEQNGLISELDHYVWEKAAEQMQTWKEQGLATVPVSVNLSRIDLYNPKLSDLLTGILEKHNLSTNDFVLEITESAYVENPDVIIASVDRLHEVGFKIEMDDFGSGYSSLGMLTRLPVDGIKLDRDFKHFIEDDSSSWIVDLAVDATKKLGVPSIAEGVETEEQLRRYRELGCDIVQGRFFSPPLTPEAFAILLESTSLEAIPEEMRHINRKGRRRRKAEADAVFDLSNLAEVIISAANEPNPEMAISTLIEHLGLALKADSVIIFESKPGHTAGITHEWSHSNLPVANSPHLQNMVYEIPDEWLNRLRKGDIVFSDTMNVHITMDDQPRFVLSNDGTDRVAMCPLLNNGKVIGTFSVVNPIELPQERLATVLPPLIRFTSMLMRSRDLVADLEGQSDTDAVTGLLNRRGLDTAMNDYIERNPNRPCVLIALDVDNFKFINDLHGHAAGDEALKRLAAALIEAFGAHSIVGRNGGDEFMILVKDKTAKEVRPIIENLQSQPQQFAANGRLLSFSISAGYAEMPSQAREFSGLARKADAALYAVKLRQKGSCQQYEAEMSSQSRSSLGFSLQDISREMPGALLIHQAHGEERILYANNVLISMLGCADFEEFLNETGGSFKTFVNEKDLQNVEEGIWKQIGDRSDNLCYAEYGITCKSGETIDVWSTEHLVNNPEHGDVFYALIHKKDDVSPR